MSQSGASSCRPRSPKRSPEVPPGAIPGAGPALGHTIHYLSALNGHSFVAVPIVVLDTLAYNGARAYADAHTAHLYDCVPPSARPEHLPSYTRTEEASWLMYPSNRSWIKPVT